MGFEQKGLGYALLMDSIRDSNHIGGGGFKANSRVVYLKGRNVNSPTPFLLPASWNDDVKIGAGAAILLCLAHYLLRMATSSKEPGSLIAK